MSWHQWRSLPVSKGSGKVEGNTFGTTSIKTIRVSWVIEALIK